MALHNGIDTCAFVSGGVYTENYGAADPENIANLFVSYGLVEDAPIPSPAVSRFRIDWKATLGFFDRTFRKWRV